MSPTHDGQPATSLAIARRTGVMETDRWADVLILKHRAIKQMPQRH